MKKNYHFPILNMPYACRYTILVMLMLFGFKGINLFAQTTVTIGAGSQSGTSSNGATGDCGPMYRSTATSNFVYSRHHYLYTATELSAAGVPAGNNITKLAWNNQNGAGTNFPCVFQIWIKNSSLTDVGAGGQLWATLISGSTQVYNNSSHTVPATVGWHEITLSTPFLYTGGALEISVNFDISAGSSPWTTAGFSWFKDPITGRTLSYVGSAAPSTTLPNLRTVRAQIQMTYVGAGACVSPPTPGTATATPSSGICVGTNIALNLTGNSTGTGQTYQWQSSATGGGIGFTDIGSPLPSPLLNITASTSLFYRCQVTCSANTQTSAEVSVSVNPPFPGGTYTINSAMLTGGSNYQTFAAAVAALSCGISGPVTFNVDPLSGPYTEQITIPAIGGTSAINTITFNGNNRILQFTPVTAARHVLKLDGADYITINNLEIKGLATDFDWGIHLINGADNNTISNCTIDINANTSATQSNSAGIVASNSSTSVITIGNNTNNLTVTGCTIKGAYTGIILYGNTGSLNALNNSITNNVIQDFYSVGVELNNNDGALIQNNNIHRTNRILVGTFEGIELGTTNKNVLINANRIHDTHTSATTQSGTAYGIYFTGSDAPAGSENRITNNLIYNFNSLTGTQYGIYSVGSDGAYYYHNTVALSHAASTSGTTYAFHQTTAATNVQIRDNILFVTRGGTGTKNCLRFATTTSTIISNNNNLFMNAPAGTNGVGFYSVNFPTLANWQTANGGIYDTSSISIDPLFSAPGAGNFQPTNLSTDNMGAPVGVNFDINNSARSITTPDIGAYEYTISAGIDVGAFALVTPLSTGCYTDLQTVVIRIKNYGSLIDFSVDPVTVTCYVSGTTADTLTGTISTGVLAINSTVDLLLTGTFDMSVNGSYTFNAFTTCASDGNSANDAMIATNLSRAPVVAGTVSSNLGQVCLSGTPVLTLTGNAGGNIQWQESTISNTGPWTNVGAGTNTYSAGTITLTTFYQAVVSCLADIVPTNVDTVVVNNPLIITTTPGQRCGVGTVDLSATSTLGSSPSWYNVPSGGSSLASGNSFTTPVISSTTTFYVEPVVGGGGADSLAVPLASGGTTGVYHHMFLISSPTGLTVNGFGIKCNQAIGTLTSWDIYYRPDNYQLIPGSNLSSAGWTLLSTVTNIPSVGATDYTIIAMALSLDIPAASTYSFYVAPAAGTTHQYGTSAAGTLVTSNLNASVIAGHRGSSLFNCTTTAGFPVVKLLYSLGCIGLRVPVLATINTPPAITVSSGSAAVCNGNSTTVSVSSPNDPNYAYSWTSNPPGFTASGPGPHIITPASTTTYILNAIDTSGLAFDSCTNVDSVTVIAIGSLSAGIASSVQSTYCLSGTPTIVLSGSAGAVQWQESTVSATGPWTNIGTGDTTYTPPVALTQTTYYQAVVTCQTDSLISNVLTITVENPQILSTQDSTRCGIGTVQLQATGSAGTTIDWFAASTGGTSLGSGSPFVTPVISSTTTYYAQASTGGGNSGVTPMPPQLSAFSGNVRGYSFTAPVSFTLTGIECLSTAAGNQHVAVVRFNPPVQPPAFSASTNAFTTLFLSQNNANLGVIPCNILINAGDVIGILGQKGTTSSYANPAGPYTTTIAGQSVVLTRMLMQFPLGTTAPMNLSTEATGSIGRVALTYEIGCASLRVPVTATVTPSPPVTISGTNVICQGSSTTLSVGTGMGDYTNFDWFPSTGLSATNGNSVTASPLVTTKYYLFASGNVNNCQAVDSITITVNSFTLQILVDNPLVCGSNLAQLNASTSAGTYSYAWTPSTGLSNTAISNPTAQLTGASETYTVTVTDLGNSCTKSSSITLYRSDPQIFTTTGDTRCGTGPVDLSATGTPGQVYWWSLPTGGTLLNIGSPYTPTIGTTTTYYASLKDVIPQTPVSTGFTGGTIATDPNAAGNMFNITALHDIKISGFDIHLNDLPLAASNISVYYKAGTYVGFTTNAGVWTLAGSVSGVTSAGTGIPTPVPLTLNINIPSGQTYGIYIVVTNLGVSNSLIYNNSATSLAEGVVASSDYNMQVHTGTVVFGPFTGVLAAPVNRLWNGNVKYSIGCESGRTAVLATVSPAPAITVTGGSAICPGSSTNLSVSSPNDPNYTYTWNPGSLTGSIVSVSPITGTIYTVIASDTSGNTFDGCLNSDTISVAVNPAPTITSVTASSPTICDSGPVTLTALTGSSTPGFINIGTQTTTISGNVGNPYRSGNVIGNQIRTQLLVLAGELTGAGLSAGDLTSLGFTTTTAAGTMVNFTIRLGHTAATTLTTTYLTTPMTTVFTQASFAAVIGLNTHIFSTPFNWDGTSNIVVEVCQQNSVLGTTTVAAFSPGYSSNVANAVVGGCTALTGTVVANKPIMRFGGLIGGGAGPGSFAWQWAPGGLPPGHIATANPVGTTVYTVTATSPGTGCTTTSTLSISVTPNPKGYAYPTDSMLCQSGFLEVYARDSGAYANGWPAGTLFSWDGSPFGTFDSVYPLIGNWSYPAFPALVILLPSNLGGCTDTLLEPPNLSFRERPFLTLESDSVNCFGGSDGAVIASVLNGASPYRYRYYDNLGTLIRDTVRSEAFDTLFNVPTGTYWVIVRDTVNTVAPPPSCPSDSNAVFVSEPNLLVATQSNPGIACFGYSTLVTIDGTGGTPPYSGTGVFTQFAGSQTYPITDFNGCASQVIVNLTEPDVLTVSLTPANTFCTYLTASITSSVSGGTPAFSYAWSNGATTASLSGLALPGAYTVTVTDINGCSATASATVNPPGPIVITGTATNLVCRGISTGAITTAVTGGIPGYTYIWNGGNTNSSRSGLPVGTYVLTVTDANGCTKKASFVITQPATAMIVNTSKTNVRCFGLSSGVATVTPSGGSMPYTYSWNTIPVKTTASISGLSAGVYTCTITDAVGCIKNVNITITQPTDINVLQTQSNVTFPGGNNGSATVTVSGGTPAYTYKWNTIPVQTTSSATGLTAGTYKCTVTDSKSCTKKLIFIITEPIAKDGETDLFSESLDVKAYPNPTSGLLLLTINSKNIETYHVSLMDFTGRMLYAKSSLAEPGRNDYMYDFTGYAKGIYFLRLATENNFRSIRIIIQ